MHGSERERGRCAKGRGRYERSVKELQERKGRGRYERPGDGITSKDERERRRRNLATRWQRKEGGEGTEGRPGMKPGRNQGKVSKGGRGEQWRPGRRGVERERERERASRVGRFLFDPLGIIKERGPPSDRNGLQAAATAHVTTRTFSQRHFLPPRPTYLRRQWHCRATRKYTECVGQSLQCFGSMRGPLANTAATNHFK